MKTRISGLWTLCGEGVRRFPLVVLAAVVGTVVGIVGTHSEFKAQSIGQIVMTTLIAFPVLAGAVYAGELRRCIRWWAQVPAVLAIIVMWYYFPSDESTFAMGWGYFLTVLALLLLVLAVPGLGGASRWWRINVETAQALVLASVVTAVVGIGLSLALFSIGELFDVATGIKKLYGDVMLIGVLFIAPMAVIALLPRVDDERSLVLERFWRNLGLWVLVPLGFLFIGIIAVYAGMILVVGDFPDGMVAMPVLVLGAYGTLAMLLLQPWRETHGAARWFARIYPVAFLASAVLLFMALNVRLTDYGMTFVRYSGLAAGVWLVIAAGLLLFRVRLAGMFIMIVGAILALTAAIGPFSAATMSLRSQSERLKTFLESKSQSDQAEQIRSAAVFISSNFGLVALEKVTGPLGLDSKLRRWELNEAIAKKLGVMDASNVQIEWRGEEPVDIAGFSKLYGSESARCDERLLGTTAAGEPLVLNMGSNTFRVEAGGKTLLDLAPQVQDALVKHQALSDETSEPLQVPFTVEGRDFVLLIIRASFTQSGEERDHFRVHQYLVLEK